jgi:hypothetical protein
MQDSDSRDVAVRLAIIEAGAVEGWDVEEGLGRL